MTDLGTAVNLAVDVLVHIMRTGERHEQLSAAEAMLVFASTLPAGLPVPEPCRHVNKTNMTTMGGGPLHEHCPDCGTTWSDGAMVERGSST